MPTCPLAGDATATVCCQLVATDRGQVSALCLLDLTAAFDTVDHQLLLRRLVCQFGLRGIALGWFQSYLSGRSYRVIYAGSTSSVIYIVCSVPQGSVLGGPSVVYNICGRLCGHCGPTQCYPLPSQMTRICTYTVTARTPPRQPLSRQTALSMSADG